MVIITVSAVLVNRHVTTRAALLLQEARNLEVTGGGRSTDIFKFIA